jgi:hypothetical protein
MVTEHESGRESRLPKNKVQDAGSNEETLNAE